MEKNDCCNKGRSSLRWGGGGVVPESTFVKGIYSNNVQH